MSSISNYDPACECHFGVISIHSVHPDALDDVYQNGKNLTYEACVGQVKAELRSAISDYVSSRVLDEAVDAAFEGIEDDLNDAYESNGEEVFLYGADGYKISNSPLLVCLFVEKSPYYTYTRGCSPCAPNAGDLDNPDGSLKTFCLGEEWFEGRVAPYAIYSVATDSREVQPKPAEAPNA